MKYRIFAKRILSFLLILAVFLGFGLGLQGATVTESAPVTSLQTGTYSLVMSFSHVDYSYYFPYETVDSTQYPGFSTPIYDPDSPGSASQWKIVRVSSTKCTVQNEGMGENGYLNIAPNVLCYGPRQELNYEFSGGKCKFYLDFSGTRYYIRVTSQNLRRFQAGTGTSSNAFSLCRTVSYEQTVVDNGKIPAPAGDPILTLACVTDLHTDWQMQNKFPYVRNSLHQALTRIAREEDADVFLSGGDNTSDNAGQSEYAWPKSVYDRVIDRYDFYAGAIAPHQLWACGNHDDEVGEDEGYDSYAGYEGLMTGANGAPESIYRQKQDRSLTDQRYPEFVLGVHYEIEGFDFIVLNSPYGEQNTYSSGTLNWLRQRLSSIGKEKTVFFLTHYPLSVFRGPYAFGSGTGGESGDTLVEIFSNYPNLIFLYGHTHNGDGCYIADDTFEQVTSFSPVGSAVQNRNAVPVSFISSFMGSMSYSKHDITPDYLYERDADIVQALMIYLYKDRIVFQMKNYGAHPSNADKILKSWTVMRDLSAYAGSPASDPEQDASTDQNTSSSVLPSDTADAKPSSNNSSSNISSSARPSDPVPADPSDQPTDSAEISSERSPSSDIPQQGGATDVSAPSDGSDPAENPASGSARSDTIPSQTNSVLSVVAVAVFTFCGVAVVGIGLLLFFLYRRYRLMIKK